MSGNSKRNGKKERRNEKEKDRASPGHSSKSSSSPPLSSKKIIVYALIGIIAVAAVSVSFLGRGMTPPGGNAGPPNDREARALENFRRAYCSSDPTPNSSAYVREFTLPSECELPVGIEVVGGGQNEGSNSGTTVWYVSTKRGTLGSYDPVQNKFGKEHLIPSWPARSSPAANPTMSWDVKADAQGNIWFTAEDNALWKFERGSETFSVYRTPAIYPASFDFDGSSNSGGIYLTGFRSKSLWYGDLSAMKNGTSEGISEIPLPLDAFSGIAGPIGSGSLVVDSERNAVWVPLLVFGQKGEVFRYDTETKQVSTFPIPRDLASPSGMALDDSGSLWIADHLTSIFFKLDPSTGSVTKYATSLASPRIHGGVTTPADAYTLPYWIEKGPDGGIWFNEHTGNKIARFDPEQEVLVEYWIPTQSRALGFACPPDARSCGLANALQFSVGGIEEGQVWFSEWTENKIGTVDAGKQLPFSVSVAGGELTVARGDSAEIKVTVGATAGGSAFAGRMVSSGTFTPTGALGNSTGIFSEESVSLAAGGSKQVSYVFTPAQDLAPGQYTLMIGAENDDVSYLKAVKVNVV